MNILPHVRFHCLVCTSFPTCTVPVRIFELSVPLLPHVQFHPNMHYPFLAHVRSKLHLINNNFIKINDQKIFSRLIMVRLDFRGVGREGAGGVAAPQILADQKAPPGSGGAPHYYLPPPGFLTLGASLLSH